MSRTNADRFRDIVSAVLGVPAANVTDDLSADTTDTWDSLNHINLVGALEQEFSVRLPTESLADSHSVVKLKALLAEHGVDM